MDDIALKNLLGDGIAPASDPAFAIAVMARIEHRQFHRALWRIVGVGAACAVLLALAAPALNEVYRLLISPLSNDAVGLLAGPFSNQWVLAGLLLAGAALVWRGPLRI